MLNIKVDKQAWGKLETYRQGPTTFHIPWSQGVWYMGPNWIAKDFAATIWDHMNGQKTTDYWTKRRRMLQGIWNTINWESIGWAMKELSINCWWWVLKYVSGHFAMGKTCRDGDFGPQLNAQDAWNHMKTNTTYWCAPPQLLENGGRNQWTN